MYIVLGPPPMWQRARRDSLHGAPHTPANTGRSPILNDGTQTAKIFASAISNLYSQHILGYSTASTPKKPSSVDCLHLASGANGHVNAQPTSPGLLAFCRWSKYSFERLSQAIGLPTPLKLYPPSMYIVLIVFPHPHLKPDQPSHRVSGLPFLARYLLYHVAESIVLL